MVEVIQVRLREAGKVTFYNARGIKYAIGDYVIVEADRGIDYGQVMTETELIDNAVLEEPLKAIIRRVDPKDQEKIQKNIEKAHEAHMTCMKKIFEHQLPMKLVDTEYSFDVSKLVFYFTSEGRVDFRDLVKDLASVFKVRIELRQIGVRDEAKMLGGFGHCGRELCCVKFLKDFEPVTIKMAKEQNLSLNPTKISGACGRLMCCLEYENDTYRAHAEFLPSEGERLKTPEGTVKVRSVNVLKKKVMVEYEDGLVKELSFAGCTCPKHECSVHKCITVLKSKKNAKENNSKESSRENNKDKDRDRDKDKDRDSHKESGKEGGKEGGK